MEKGRLQKLVFVDTRIADSAGTTSSPGLARELPWLIPVGVAACGLTVFLLTQGQSGSEIANTLSLPVSIAAVAAAVVLARMDRPMAASSNSSGRRWQTWKLLTALMTTAVVSAAGAVVVVRAIQPSTKCSEAIRHDPAKFLSGKLTIGLNGRLPGWSSGDGEEIQKWSGFDVELVRFIAKQHGLDPDRDLKLKRLLSTDREKQLQVDPDSQDCGVHLVFSSYSMTPKRDNGTLESGDTGSLPLFLRKPVDFAGPYFQSRRGTAQHTGKVPLGSTVPIERTCVTKATTADLDLGPTAPVRLDTIEQCMTRLFERNDKVAAVTTDVTLLRAFVAEHRNVTEVTVTVDPASQQENYGIGIPDDSPELCRALSEDIAKFMYQNDDTQIPAWNTTFKSQLGGQEPVGHKPSSVDLSWCHD